MIDRRSWPNSIVECFKRSAPFRANEDAAVEIVLASLGGFFAARFHVFPSAIFDSLEQCVAVFHGSHMSLDLSAFLNQVKNSGNWQDMQRGLFQMLSQVQDHVNNGFAQLGVTTMSTAAPPDPPEQLSVVANNGTVHATITHNAPITKTLHYFVEASANDPAFQQPHVFDLGASRSLFTSLPTKDGSGDDINWMFRTYAQYHGSKPSASVNFGGKYNPTPVVVGGSAAFTPLASTGSGTAPANGQAAAQGLGNDYSRPQKIVQRGVQTA